jgi:hypothetical protein
MRSMVALLFVAAVGFATASDANAVVIKTSWVETNREFGNNTHFMRFYVRKIEITRTTWKAWVGVTNGTGVTLDARTEEVKGGNCCPQPPFAYWSGPSLLWYRIVPGFEANPVEATKKADYVRPAYPKSLKPHKSWFGVFGGTLSEVPRDRLLSIGFGHFVHDASDPRGRVDFGSFATNHQFRLPRRV